MQRIIGIALSIFLLVGGVVVWAAPAKQTNEFQLFMLQARLDVEIMANAVLGEGERLETWTGTTDLESPTLVVDLWYDHEQLADVIFEGSRPDEWFGATTSDLVLLSRNIRHDIELSADELFGDERPNGWNGASRIYRCDRTLQNTVRLLDVFYGIRLTTPQNVRDFCGSTRLELLGERIEPVFERAAETVDLQPLVLAIRGDLERLANESLGVNNRPPNWIGNTDIDSSSFAGDIRTDLETLADNQLGSGERPSGWSVISSSSFAIAERYLRTNLELLANMLLGPGVRPNGWQNEDIVKTCNRVQQALVLMVQDRYGFVIDETLAESPSFCELVEFTANDIADNPPLPSEEEEQAQEDLRFVAQSEYAFAYLDPAATQYMGIMPAGTLFRAWYRNFNESTMMFVSGEDFAVYIDQRWTTLDPDLFNSLPNLEDVVPLTFCDANWCNGPGPTPTPTGGGPLLAVHNDTTPIATLDAGSVSAEGGKTQVSWNHIRVTYLLDRPETGTVQVALEICQDVQQINCEPVNRVFDNALGAAKPVISQLNGLNVFELPYGYSSNFVIEGATLVSPDVWISDPTIR